MGNSPSESVHKKLLSLYDISPISWSLIYDSQNYYKLALATQSPTYQLSVGGVRILRAITAFVPRVLEQSLLTHLKLSLTSLSNAVLFTYNTWPRYLVYMIMQQMVVTQ
jgi:hypothetical protein